MKALLRNILFVAVIFLSELLVFSQDSTNIFTYEEFLEIVKRHHPIAALADLKPAQGNAVLQKAKGGFDPVLSAETYQKYFDGKQYYSYINGGLKIPTWFGISAQTGYNLNRGDYLNPESVTPTQGLWYAGLTVNLGNGLIIDKRRAELQQAEIFKNSTLLEQKLIVNQLIYDASIAYWDWFISFNKKTIYANALTVAQERLEAVKLSCLLGDKPFIDTVEATIQMQSRKIKLEQAMLDLLNKKEQLEIFLWQDGLIPLELDSALRPKFYFEIQPILPDIKMVQNFDSLIYRHPEYLYAQNNIAILKIDNRLKKESLKPSFALKYNAIAGSDVQGTVGSYSINDYAWGAQMSYPIFTRKERADLALNGIKIQEQEFKMMDKNAVIKYKIESAYNNWISTALQAEFYQQMVKNYEVLFKAESSLFGIGESSLFLVNSRDQAMIDAQLGLVEVLYQNYSSSVYFNYQIVSI